MNISINRALSELKLVTKKINDKTARLEVCAAWKSGADEVAKVAAVDKADSAIQSIRGLIEHRNCIKSSIVRSNAETIVTVSKKSMTVAEAIERKTSIELDRALNKRMREHYYGNKQGVESHNTQAGKTANSQVTSALGADTEGDKGAAAKAIFAASYDANKAELLAPENIEAEIEADQESIDEFEAEIDFILSESNTKTLIDV